MPTLVHRRVEQARKGENPTVICRVQSGWVVLGDVQVLPGYALLLHDPVVESLNSLNDAGRQVFFRDMGLLGDALLEVTGAERINYEILGSAVSALHAHVFPRYPDEPVGLRERPVWFYDWEQARHFAPERDCALMQRIASAIGQLGGCRDAEG